MDSDNLSRLFSQPNIYSTDHSAHGAPFVPIVEGPISGSGILRRRKELWAEDSRSPYYRRVTISSLPDDALLEIFNFYVDELHEDCDIYYEFDGWHTLVHVCQRWRIVVFSSPRRLDLQLLCWYGRPVREMLDIWPELPIIVVVGFSPPEEDQTTAALKLADRVSRISFWNVSSSALEKYTAVMQVPFPALKELAIWWDKLDEAAPVLSDEFLGKSAPRLQYLSLEGVAFPGLRKLLLSTTNFVILSLEHIPHSGYISPEEMAICLSGLPRLDKFYVGFQSPRSRPSQASQRPHPLIRASLPSLTRLHFKGATEYLEDLVSRIDVPSLEDFIITLFNQLTFDILQLPEFLCRTGRFPVLVHSDMVFHADGIEVELSPQTETVGPRLKFGISCRKSDWQLSALPQLCISCLSTFANLERLEIREYLFLRLDWQDDIEVTQWAELLHPFTTVKDLYLSKEIAPRVIPALHELAAERVTDVLPVLEGVFLYGLQPPGHLQDAIGQFVAARQLSGHPIVIHLLGEKK